MAEAPQKDKCARQNRDPSAHRAIVQSQDSGTATAGGCGLLRRTWKPM
jgi:hypothetical protein